MKILVIKNNIKDTDIDALNKGLGLVKQYCSTIGLDIFFTFKDTARQFTTVTTQNQRGDSVVGVVTEQIFSEADTGYDIVCLMYDWDKVGLPRPTNPMSSSIKQKGEFTMQIPIQWYGYPHAFPDCLADYFLHEMCHILFFGTDKMDSTHFTIDRSLNSAVYDEWIYKPAKDYYLYLLKDLIPLVSLTATLTRNSDNGIQTTGILQVGDFKCFTLERTWKNNAPNISCIPKGIYSVKKTFSFRFLKYTYELQNVKDRSGIRFHSGNYFNDIIGCILLGDSYGDINKDGQQDILNSRITIKKFEDLMQNKSFKLEIK